MVVTGGSLTRKMEKVTSLSSGLLVKVSWQIN